MAISARMNGETYLIRMAVGRSMFVVRLASHGPRNTPAGQTAELRPVTVGARGCLLEDAVAGMGAQRDAPHRRLSHSRPNHPA